MELKGLVNRGFVKGIFYFDVTVYVPSSSSAEVSAGQIQTEGVLHPCWMHLGGS